MNIMKKIANDTVVAEQIDKFINVKNPPNCVGGIHVFIHASVLVSLLKAPYEIYSSKCNCLRVISWSSTRYIKALRILRVQSGYPKI
jgi:hypothetical protein